MPGPNRAPRGGYQKPKNLKKTVSRLLGYLTRSKLPLLAVLVFLLLSVATNIGGSYMMRGIINDFVWSGCTDFAGLGRAILLLIAVELLSAAATYGQSAIMVQLAQRGVNRLRRDLFDKLQNLPLSYFDRHPHGELMSRFTNDADNVQLALEQSVVSMLSSCFTFVGLVAMMLIINWKLFVVTALVLALTMTLFKQLGGRSRRFYQQQQAALGKVNGSIQETIEGLKVVKAFTHEEQAKADFQKLNQAYRDAAQKANFYSTMIMPVSGNLMNISYALTAAVGGLLSVLQGFDLGGLVVYLNYSKQVGQPMNQISQQMTTLLSAMAGAERIFQVMDTQPETDQGQVTLVRAKKENGVLTPLAPGQARTGTWAWKVPKSQPMRLVRVLHLPDKTAEIINNETARLYNMVEELLDFSRLQNGRLKMTCRPLDLVAELTDAVLFCEARIQREGLVLVYNEPEEMIPVYADPDRLRQVFINILDNAIKYSAPGGRITVKLWAGEYKAFIEFIDQGRGIPPEDLENVKTKFYKGSNSVRGSGIGLALVDSIMTALDGTMDIKSTLGRGTVVTLGLPLYKK